MRYKRFLSKEQIDFIIKNPTAKSRDLAKIFHQPATIIYSYKSRLRKRGISLPLERKK